MSCGRIVASSQSWAAMRAVISLLFLLVMIFQKQIVSGLTAGTVKG